MFANLSFRETPMRSIVLRMSHLPLLGIHGRARPVPGRGRADSRLRLSLSGAPKKIQMEVATAEARLNTVLKNCKLERMDPGRALEKGIIL